MADEYEVTITKKGQRLAHIEATITPGDVLFIPANEKQQFVNSGPAPLSFICLIPAPHDCS